MEALETKLTQLNLAADRTESINALRNETAIERHLTALKVLTAEADQCKRVVEETKIAAKESPEDLNLWITEVDGKILAADESVKSLKETLEELRQEELLKKQEKELDFEQKLFETKMKFQTELQTAKKQAEEENKFTASGSASGHVPPAKLPKLNISRFDGTYEDWPRFWNQFVEIIDKTSMAGVTKFAYLKSFLDPKVKKSIEGLPFSNEGYNRAKSVLLDKHGKDSEIIKAYTQMIFDLPIIPDQNVARIHEFSDKLTFSVQSLQTMGKLEQVNGYVAMTLDKLPAIRGDLTRTDTSWENWTFDKLTEALRLWTRRNPLTRQNGNQHEDRNRNRPDDRNWRENRSRRDDRNRRDKPPSWAFNTQQSNGQRTQCCVYCEATDHKSFNCTNVIDVGTRRSILLQKRLCFNCTGPHKAEHCRSKMTCQTCNQKHHTSICDSTPRSEGLLTARLSDKPEVVYPVVLVNVDGIKTRALLDTGAGSSYASAQLINALRKKPAETQTKRIEMMLGSMTTKVEMYNVTISSITGDFSMGVTVSKVNKPELMKLDNPKYEDLLKKYVHLSEVEMDDKDTKAQLPIHLVLGASEYARIKTSTPPKIALSGQPIAEKTTLGWTIMSPGHEGHHETSMFMTQSINVDFEQLTRLDVLGLPDSSENDQDVVYSEFKEQLSRHPDGYYETGLPWRGNHPTLPTNEFGSRRRLQQLLRKLDRTNIYDQYAAIIQEQKEQGIVEPAPAEPKGTEFYIPHRAVVRENAETTKLRVVYDASAKESSNQPSLNDCLHPGPPLQNLLWSVLIRARFYPVLLTGDLQKAFLQVRIKEEERDALRFHWKFKGHSEIETLRFTRALFGLTSSPFLLGGVIQQHLKAWEEREPELVAQIRKSLYVDDLITGAPTVKQTQQQKEKATEIFNDAQFTLHKWKSNAPELEQQAKPEDHEEESFAKQQLGTKTSESKLLGLPWDPNADTLSVCFPQQKEEATKRGVLSHLAKIYDPLGLVSPMTLSGKFVFRDMCERKLHWDTPIPTDLEKDWKKWSLHLPQLVSVKRTIAPFREAINSIQLHAFGDASSKGVCAAVYAVVNQESGTTQGLVTSKSRLSKRSLTIPRLELVAGHMAVNLAVNVRDALQDCNAVVYCWLDSTVALYWIKGSGEYRQFVANRVQKIQQHEEIVWRHVPTNQNPADLGSRGGTVTSTSLWMNGPQWLPNPDQWPRNVEVEPSSESRSEAKVTKEILSLALPMRDAFSELLGKYSMWKTIRICAWMARFIANCRNPKSRRIKGPLFTDEIRRQEDWWTSRTQAEARSSKNFPADSLQLNLQPNESGILECRGRIIGTYPIYLPDDSLFTHKFVQQAHLMTLHGGVTLTMAKVRETHWIPRLRRLTKKVIKGCWGCKRFQAQAYQSPPPGNLPLTRTQGETPYQAIGVDFAGPIKYRLTQKTEGKAYLVLYTCSLTRGVYLDLLPSLETSKFLTSLKGFIARRGRPQVIYSDNGSTFKAAADWMSKVMKDEKFQNQLTQNDIAWRFNLSRAPWWGGQFERLIGVFKCAFRKAVGNGTLSWRELSDVVLDVEIAVNSRPLSYQEEDVEMPLLTPSSMLHLRPNHLPELSVHHLPERDLRKRAKYLLRCKEAMWSRWTREYVRSLRERHSKCGGDQTPHPSVGDVVIIQDESRNRNTWKLGIVESLITGRDGIIRAARMRAGKGVIERAVQHLYPLELSVDRAPKTANLNPTVPSFRPRRAAAVVAKERIKEITNDEQDEL